MGDSEGAWGEMSNFDSELADVFDQYERLPEPGQNPALDAFVERKRIDIDALVRLGARLSPPDVLVFGFPGGIKFRELSGSRRWNYIGSDFSQLKIVRAGRQRPPTVIVAEGETDAARLLRLYPDADIAVLPAGAHPGKHAPAYAKQLDEYELVLLAQDYGSKGDEGAAVLQEHLTTKALRWRAPIDGDDNTGWNDVPLEAEVPPIPAPEDVEVPVEERTLVRLGELLAAPTPEINSYLEQAMLPVGGSMVIHGSMKSYKSWLALDLASALAQAGSWAHFEAVDEPQKIVVLQYEIPWAFYQDRLRILHDHAQSPELLRENFVGWTPMVRPRFRAGDRKAEDQILKTLVDNDVTVFMLDPIRRAAGVVDLNSEKEVRPMLDFFDRLNQQGISVITTHHDNKQSSRGGSGDPYGMTGSGAFGGDPDVIVSVALPKGHDLQSKERNLHFLLRNAPSPGPRAMRILESGALEYEDKPIGDEDAAPLPNSEQPAI